MTVYDSVMQNSHRFSNIPPSRKQIIIFTFGEVVGVDKIDVMSLLSEHVDP